MRRDLFHYFNTNIEAVYNAYSQVVKVKPFKKVPDEKPYSRITFGLGYSYIYNMNGGAVHIHFAKYNTGTAVQVRYSIVQLMGAKYKKYDRLLTEHVEDVLRMNAEKMEPFDIIKDDSDDPAPVNEPVQNAPAPQPVVNEQVKPQPSNGTRPKFCPYCGSPLSSEGAFCPNCGKKVL